MLEEERATRLGLLRLVNSADIAALSLLQQLLIKAREVRGWLKSAELLACSGGRMGSVCHQALHGACVVMLVLSGARSCCLRGQQRLQVTLVGVEGPGAHPKSLSP